MYQMLLKEHRIADKESAATVMSVVEVGRGPDPQRGRSQCPHSQQGIGTQLLFQNSHPETADPWLAFDGSYPLNHLVLPMFSTVMPFFSACIPVLSS